METRRDFLQRTIGAVAATALPGFGKKTPGTMGLGYDIHGFKGVPPDETIKVIAGIGYDSVAMCLVPGWTEPLKCTPEDRRKIRAALLRGQLAVPKLFERLPITGDDSAHKAVLERIRVDAQFGHDVNAGIGGVRPCIGSRLDGASKNFEAMKTLLVDRLGDWAQTGREMDTVIALKGHPPFLCDTSEQTRWVVEKVNSPWLRVELDYSHFQAVGEDLDKCLDILLPYLQVIALQDSKKKPDQSGHTPTLPGDGDIDYLEYYTRLVRFGYHGHTIVWVNDALMKNPGWDGVEAAKHCYANLSPVMAKAGARRPNYRQA